MEYSKRDVMTFHTCLPEYLRERNWRVLSSRDASAERPGFAYGVTIGGIADGPVDLSIDGFSSSSWEEAVRIASVTVLIDVYRIEADTAWKTCFPGGVV